MPMLYSLSQEKGAEEAKRQPRRRKIADEELKEPGKNIDKNEEANRKREQADQEKERRAELNLAIQKLGEETPMVREKEMSGNDKVDKTDKVLLGTTQIRQTNRKFFDHILILGYYDSGDANGRCNSEA